MPEEVHRMERPSLPDTRPPADRSQKVLIADDDHLMRAMLAHILTGAGYRVEAAANGQEVLDRMDAGTGVLILDLNMPVMDGMTCLQALQAHHPDARPVMVTASDAISDAVQAMKNGAFDYLTKPINRHELLVVTQKAMASWRRARRMAEMERELDQVAYRIQQTLLLGDPPRNMPGLEIASLSIPSQNIDGDFYDFFRLSDQSLDLVVGDVMGKGVAAALLGAAVKSHILRAINTCHRDACGGSGMPDPGRIVARLHEQTNARISAVDSFVTLCYARFDLKRSRLTYVDCGHMPTLHFQAADRRVAVLTGTDMPIGFPECDAFHQHQVTFAPGDLFLFYSDGITEARAPDGTIFEERRLIRFLTDNGRLPPGALITALTRRLESFTGTHTFHDDLTCLAVRAAPHSP